MTCRGSRLPKLFWPIFHLLLGRISPDVMLDKNLDMDAQIKSVCRSALYHIRNIGAIRKLLPQSAAAQLIHSLVTSRIDYCNSLLYGLPNCRIKQLQRIQNIAARAVTLTRCSPGEHITPVLKSLHWLPIKFRIVFKILLLTYKCVNGIAPEYLCNLVIYKDVNFSHTWSFQITRTVHY